MTASYKRKRLIEEDCLDKKPTYIRKSLNSSERIKTKRQIQKTVNDRFNIVDELRWELETRQCVECHHNEIFGPHTYIQIMLALLGVGDFDLYKCICIDFYKLSDEEILRMSGL
jgi:hypothetical protein